MIYNMQVNVFSAVDPAFIKSAAARRVVVPERTFAERVRGGFISDWNIFF